MANEFTRYQAAVLYDFCHGMQAGSPTWPVRELVVDTDTGTLGLCSCTRDGVVTLLAQAGTVGSPLAQLWLERLAADCGAPFQALAERLFFAPAQQTLWNYYRTGSLFDEEAFALTDGQSLRCSRLDAAFTPVRDLLEPLLDQGLDLLDAQGVPEETLRILTVGRLAGSAPVRLALRRQLCGDPFLPDDRFADLPADADPARIVEEGMTLYRNMQVAGIDVDLLCVDRDGTESAVPLVQRKEPASVLQTPRYCAPVFYDPTEPLRLRVNGLPQLYPSPFAAGPLGGELIQLGCLLRDGRPFVRVRRSLFPERVHDLELHPGKEAKA